MPDYARQGRLADEYLAEIAARRGQAGLAKQPESAAYHCTYCRADGDQLRCSNCGAPADRIVTPVVPAFDPADPSGQRAHFTEVVVRPRKFTPADDEEIAYAREWITDHPR